MSNETIHHPGHSVHLTHAREALEEVNNWEAFSIISASAGCIEIVESDGRKRLYDCRDTERLLAVLATGQVPKNNNGGHLAFLAPHSVLVVPCAELKKEFPTSAPIYPSVVYLENGAALWSPTTDGAWHLFSVIWFGSID